jgi:hypothetical protein
MDTTRKFPRTLQEAFPRDRHHAYAIERPYQARYESIAGVVLAVAVGVSLAIILVRWWSS